MCNAHEKISLGMNLTIMEQLQRSAETFPFLQPYLSAVNIFFFLSFPHRQIKEFEQTRKEHLETGFKITKTFQDQYTTLKKAKVEFDEAQKFELLRLFFSSSSSLCGV